MLDLLNAIFKKLPHQNDTDFVVTFCSPISHYQSNVRYYIRVCVRVCACVRARVPARACVCVFKCIASVQTKPSVHRHQ